MTRILHILLFCAALIGYLGDSVVCFEEKMDTQCKTTHDDGCNSHQEESCSCVCHTIAEAPQTAVVQPLLFNTITFSVLPEVSYSYQLNPPEPQPPRC